MTGWGQNGPYAHAAGRDINYVALSGTLPMIGRAGDAAGAAAQPGRGLRRRRHAARLRIVCGILEASRSGRGQVIDAAMVDGAALLAGMIHGLRGDGSGGERGTNLMDTGAWFYEVYETADGGYVSVGAIDAQVVQRAAPADRDSTGACPTQDDKGLAGDEAADGRGDQDQDA